MYISIRTEFNQSIRAEIIKSNGNELLYKLNIEDENWISILGIHVKTLAIKDHRSEHPRSGMYK